MDLFILDAFVTANPDYNLVAENELYFLEGEDNNIIYVFEATNGYSAANTITDWFNVLNYSNIFKDFSFISIKNNIESIYGATDWDTIGDIAKSVVARLQLVDNTKQLEIFTTEEILNNIISVEKKSSEDILNRYYKSILFVKSNVSKADAEAIVNDAAMLIIKYKEFRIYGTIEGNTEGIIDYVLGRVGTSYENTGLPSSGIVPNTLTLQDFCDQLAANLNP